MDLYKELNEVELQEVQIEELRAALYDAQTLAQTLNKYEEPWEVLPLLKVCLTDGTRPYFLPRIYGRYRKLLPKYDFEILYRWAEDERKRRGIVC